MEVANLIVVLRMLCWIGVIDSTQMDELDLSASCQNGWSEYASSGLVVGATGYSSDDSAWITTIVGARNVKICERIFHVSLQQEQYHCHIYVYETGNKL